MALGYGMTDTVRLLLDCGADPRAEMGGLKARSAAAGGGAINDFADGPPLGQCLPEVIEILPARAPDLRMGSGLGEALPSMRNAVSGRLPGRDPGRDLVAQDLWRTICRAGSRGSPYGG